MSADGDVDMRDESKSGAVFAAATPGGDPAVVELLHKHLVEEFEFVGKVVEIDSTSSLLEAFKAMVNNHISSAPVYDATAKAYVGFIALPDLVKVVVDAAESADLAGVTSMATLGDAVSVDMAAPVATAVNLSTNAPFMPVKAGATMLQVARTLGNSGHGGASVHRVPVLGADGKIVKIVSQSRVIKFLNAAAPKDSVMMSKTVAELGLCSDRPVLSIGSSEPALKAFQTHVNQRVSSVAVLDDEAEIGHLLGQISCSDVLPLAGTGKFELIALPALDFISTARSIMDVVQRRGRARPPAITVSPDFTLRRVIERLAATHVHRVYVTKEHKVCGIISLKDILHVLACGEGGTTFTPTHVRRTAPTGAAAAKK